MSILVLKIIALLTMITDHYGAIFHGDVLIYRYIGRIAFPIYCFLLVEGYKHTHDVKKYAKRLLIFALISEIPFDLAFFGKIGFNHQNVFFTLLIGLIMMHLLDNKEGKYKLNKSLIYIFACIVALVAFVDYNFLGITYILAFYYTREYPHVKRTFISAIIFLLVTLVMSHSTQLYSLLAFPLIFLYNEKPGPKNKYLQLFFYIAYPLHLIIFYIFNTFI